MGSLPTGWELVLIVLLIMVLFGAKRMPDAARSLGRSMRILKAETKGLRDDDGPESTTVQDTTYPPSAVAPPAPITPPTVQPPVAAPPTVTPPVAAEQSPQRQQ